LNSGQERKLLPRYSAANGSPDKGQGAGPLARAGHDIVALLLVIVHTLILVAWLALLGQGIVGIFNWRRRQENFVYQLFAIISRPVVSAVRLVTPRVILDEHVPLVAFLLLLIGYFGVGLWHRDVCLQDLTQVGCAKWAAARAGAGR